MAAWTKPDVFQTLCTELSLEERDLLSTADGFFLLDRSIAELLSRKNVFDFLDSGGERLSCDRFFDDWFLYAVPEENAYAYGLVKMREQEHDAEDGVPSDGDKPGVTVSFIPFSCSVLLSCLAEPSEENRSRLNEEINRVVAYRGQCHGRAMKRYFKDPASQGPYLIAASFVRRMAQFAEHGRLPVPESYKELLQRSISYKISKKCARLPRFIARLNREAGYDVCDGESIFIKDRESLTESEKAAILATHTGNTSVYSFAAEVEYHAKFLTPLAKIKIPFFMRSIYDSAVRADMMVGDTEFEGPAPFYQAESKIVKRQYALHRDKAVPFETEEDKERTK